MQVIPVFADNCVLFWTIEHDNLFHFYSLDLIEKTLNEHEIKFLRASVKAELVSGSCDLAYDGKKNIFFLTIITILFTFF